MISNKTIYKALKIGENNLILIKTINYCFKTVPRKISLHGKLGSFYNCIVYKIIKIVYKILSQQIVFYFS